MKSKNPPGKVSEKQICVLKSLRADRNIVIAKPDKGNAAVILNCSKYIDKMHEIFDYRTKFMSCNQGTSLSDFTKFQQSFAISFQKSSVQ